MAKTVRKNQKLFGSTAGADQVAQYGSLAASAPVRYDGTADPDDIQALSNFLDGWFGASIGNNSPAEEDENALFFLAFYQIFYLLQTGIPEWNSETTYYIGSTVNDGLGNIYISSVDNNLNHALTDATKWHTTSGRFSTKTTTYTATVLDDFLRGDTSSGVFTITLPAAASASGKKLIFKNVGNGGNNLTIQGNASETIDGSNTMVLADLDSQTIFCNGISWDII